MASRIEVKYTPEQQVENRHKWIAALRSGEYDQGRTVLRSGDAFCCLGVACDISSLGEWGRWKDGAPVYKTKKETHMRELPLAVQDWLGLRTEKGQFVLGGDGEGTISLANLNDTGFTFEQIADLIEEGQDGLLASIKEEG